MSELDRIRKEISDLRAELRQVGLDRQRGDESLARAIKRGNLHLQAQAHAETWKRLDPDVSMLRWTPRAGEGPEQPDLSGSLVARLRRGDPVADTLGNVDAIGRVNLLWNPLLEGLTEISLVSGVWTPWGPNYEGRYDTNSGVDSVSGLGDAYSRYSPTANPYNSSICDIDTGPVAGGAFDQTVTVRAYPWIWPDFGETSYPFLGASVQVSRYGNTNHVNLTKYDAWLEIYRADDTAGTNGVVAAASDIVDMMAYGGSYASVKLSCVVPEPATGWWDYVWWWRLCLNCAYNTETVAGGDWLTWGEPLLALSNSQSVPPFGPLIGSWTPDSIADYQAAELYPRMECDASGLWFGSGAAAVDVGLRRKSGVPGALEIASTGTNDQMLYVGDDAILYDCDVANWLGAKGQQDATAGGFVFGSGKDTNLFRSGANELKTDDTFVIGDRLSIPSEIVSTVNADQNNFAPTGIQETQIIRFTSFTANRTVTGIAAGAGGDLLILVNDTAFSLLLPYESASSTDVNRFRTPNAATVTVRQRGAVILMYIGSRWSVIGSAA